MKRVLQFLIIIIIKKYVRRLQLGRGWVTMMMMMTIMMTGVNDYNDYVRFDESLVGLCG